MPCLAMAFCNLGWGDSHNNEGRNFLYTDGSASFFAFPDKNQVPRLSFAMIDQPMSRYEWLDTYIDR